MAATRPADLALKVDDHSISYAELNAQADRLAAQLVETGAGPGDRIALRANATHACSVAFMAIQRAGLVSVPIDPTAPEDRVRQILADVEPELLLSEIEGDEDLGVPWADPLTYGAEMEALPIDRERGELISIVFTSGSTGTPKGIMVGREQVEHLMVIPSPYGLPPGLRQGGIIAGTTGYVERLITLAMFMGGPLIAYEIRRHGIAPLAAWLEHERIATFGTVPTVLRHLLATLPEDQRFPDLINVSLAGETATWDDVRRLRAHLSPDARITNLLGSTECWPVAQFRITSDIPLGEGPLPAGTPTPTARVMVCGEDGEPVPDGERGEIVVEGPGGALGYWRRPELTESVFTLMPSGYRRVRTGDGGRILANGSLEHFGRIDHVVKIAGNRTELGEVESALTQLTGVAAAAASAYSDDTGSTRLTAAVMASPGATLNARVMRVSLSRRIPGYMIPDHISVVDELPRLPGGKVDRRRVAELRGSEADLPADRGREASALERSLSEIWCDVLGVKSVGLEDDFFELGGDSIRAARVFIELERRCGIDRPMSLLAEAPTIASLALALEDEFGWSALLAVQTSGSRPPLFVVHDGTGSIGVGREMAAQLGPDQPLYGIRAEGLNGQPLRASSIQELATTYIERIKELYAEGPYILYGASLGGVIAMEMARQLTSAGSEVPLVILGDAPAPVESVRAQRAQRRRPFGRRVAARLREVSETPLNERPGRVLWFAKRQLAHRLERLGSEARRVRKEERLLRRALARGEPIPAAARGRYALRLYGALMDGHVARPPFPERVLLLRTGGPRELPDRGWGELVGDQLQIVDVPGIHPDLGREASSAYVGPVLAEALRQLQ